LADERLRGKVMAARYVTGQPARIVSGYAPVRVAPDAEAEVATFCHYGDAVWVFDDADGYCWCQAVVDRYVGYVAASHIGIGAPSGPTHFVATLGSYVYTVPDLRTPAVDILPRHSAVVAAGSGVVTRGTEYVPLDTGGFLPRSSLSSAPPHSSDLAAAAELYIGCPYLWGGRSFFGIDCSGLVQSAFRDLGITVLRDTDMQRDTIGEVVPFSVIADLSRGDLIYLPGHVMIYAGDGMIIHADGATMTVRRDDLGRLMHERPLDPATFTIRRHPAASGIPLKT
jgi:cell wall-associated NlpC family hydrolase